MQLFHERASQRAQCSTQGIGAGENMAGCLEVNILWHPAGGAPLSAARRQLDATGVQLLQLWNCCCCVETVLVEHCPLSARRHEADACWVALQPLALHLSSCIGQFCFALTGCFVSLCIYQQCIAFLALTSGQKKPAMGLQSTITSQLHLRACTLFKLCWYYISLWPHITSKIFVCSKLFKSRRPQK